MKMLVEVVQVLGLIALGVLSIAIIYGVIEAFIKKITYKKRLEKAQRNFYKNINELGDVLSKIEIKKENKPKTVKKETKKTKKHKER